MRLPALAAAAVAALALAGGAGACTPTTSVSALEGDVICPTCRTTLDMSSSPIAQEMKAYIARMAAPPNCGSKRAIERQLVAQFGPDVLAVPRRHGLDLLAWLLPILGGLAAAAALAVLALRWARSREPEPALVPLPAALDAELERRVDDELRRFDG